jgi:peptidoglycan hydrolase-like protein with peptidoglycan-binding domain
MLKNDKLFQEDLKRGSKGLAVAVFQLLLLFGRFNPAIIVDGDFGEETEIGVKDLQEHFGVVTTGILDAPTREEFKNQTGLDINNILVDAFIQFPGKTFGVRP